MGKLTISTGPCSIAMLYVYQAGYSAWKLDQLPVGMGRLGATFTLSSCRWSDGQEPGLFPEKLKVKIAAKKHQGLG